MAKIKQELPDPSIIAKRLYDPILEEKVKYYCGLTPDFPTNNTPPTRVKEPGHTDPYELELWRREEFRRIKEGHFGMCPAMYFFFNYVKIWDIESGIIRPQFRVCQSEWFRNLEEVQKSKEWGLISVKRRRVGNSWLAAASVLHDCITNPMFKVGMTSKTEEDAKDLFKKVKFIYDNLQPWLRPTSSAGNTQTSIDFSYFVKDETGSRQKKGLQSEITVKAPGETSWEGSAIRKWVADECGKVGNLKALYAMSNEIMRVGTRRVGTPVMFGTSGDVGKEGKDFRDMWYDADTYKLKRFFFGGWMGIIVDKYGNDLKEDSIRWIVYERKRLEGLSSKEYTAFVQQYPLTVEEAFTSSENAGLGNVIKINAQLNKLYEDPVIEKKGYFMMNSDGSPRWVPDARGACIIYEDPEPGFKNQFVAGVDPSDHDVEDVKNASNLSMFIMKKTDGLTPPHIVFQYTDRPQVPRDFYEQAILALLYYNKTKVMIERNKAGMITYFDERGFKFLLQTAPQGLNTLITGHTWNIGVYMTKATKHYMEGLVEEYIEDYCDYIPCKELLGEFKKYGVVNTDRVYSLGMALIYLKADKTIAKQMDAVSRTIPSWSYKIINNRLQRVQNVQLQGNKTTSVR